MTTKNAIGIDSDDTDALLPFGRLRCRTSGRDGGKPHTSTWIRWATRGARLRDGTRLRLRAIKTPGGWRSCSAWADEFFDRLTADRLGIVADDLSTTSQATASTTPTPAPIPRRRTPRERLEASRRAGELLASLGC